jgi:Holliday junction resolvasome RuvABC endonuclease subunit
MILAAFDPGSTRTGWSRLYVHGGAGTGAPITCAFLDGGHVVNDLGVIGACIGNAELVAIERVRGVAYGPKGAGIVPHLIEASYACGGIAWLARSLGRRVLELTARDWRGVVLNKPHASDAEVKEAIARLVRGLPKRTNAHVRDAVGVGLGAAWLRNGRAVA